MDLFWTIKWACWQELKKDCRNTDIHDKEERFSFLLFQSMTKIKIKHRVHAKQSSFVFLPAPEHQITGEDIKKKLRKNYGPAAAAWNKQKKNQQRQHSFQFPCFLTEPKQRSVSHLWHNRDLFSSDNGHPPTQSHHVKKHWHNTLRGK